MSKKTKKHLSGDGLFKNVSDCFHKYDNTDLKAISTHDVLMSSLAVFSMKYPSLLQFDKDRFINANIKNLFHCTQVPSDTYMRERLDEFNYKQINVAFKSILSEVQRGKKLEQYKFLNNYYLISLDGTGYFSSKNVHCENCCEKKHRDGSTSYYHQMLSGVFVHPDVKQVLPLAPEPITKQDGAAKNDCERNAAKRFITQLKNDHPKLPLMIVEDGLASNAPHIKYLQQHDIRYILGAKESDHKWLFEIVNNSDLHKKIVTHGKKISKLRYINSVELNYSNPDVLVNFLECTELSPKGRKMRFCWVTDIVITDDNVFELMRGARARWKIENETFNTLKNQGYHFEHNFGHGNNNLSNVFAHMMLLAFLIDQVQELCCPVFQKAITFHLRKKYLWEGVKSTFKLLNISTWEDFYRIVSFDIKLQITYDNSA
jgi:hypothetical protein